VFAVLLLLPVCLPARAQVRPVTTIGSAAEDRLRLDQILGRTSTDGYLLRTPSAMNARVRSSGAGLWLELLSPEVRSVWNSRIPFLHNGGAMWAGRGASLLVRAGVRGGYGPVEIVLAPEFAYSQNRPFEVFPGREPGRSTFSSPWHIGAESADLPPRFGDQPVRVVGLGQSSITVSVGPVAVGASTENQWWGPGIRNAIVMSDNAQGIPHLFLRTSRPVRTPLGPVEARWIIGGLTESLYFDTVTSNDLRSLSGLVVTLQPGGSRGITLGLARTVYGEAADAGAVRGRLFDVVTRFERLANPGEADSSRCRDQLIALFGRWVFPESHFEIYAEWARMELPRSVRDLLVAPQHTQGYTLGLQWARPAGGDDRFFRFQAELTNLEQSIAYTDRPTPPDFYAGRATAHGYTQRGRVIGAAIGPGASSQWLAGDLVGPRWRAGLFAGRVRWENNALYRQWLGNWYRHDVSVFAGFRAGATLRRLDLAGEFTAGNRTNYLFQNGDMNPGRRRTIDIVNYTLALVLSPR
jgi:hypothetical protein